MQGCTSDAGKSALDHVDLREQGIQRMANAVENYLDWEKLDAILE